VAMDERKIHEAAAKLKLRMRDLWCEYDGDPKIDLALSEIVDFAEAIQDATMPYPEHYCVVSGCGRPW
jgi:hypothetical protein